MKLKLFVEGGGDAAAMKSACRQGFTTLITRAGLARRPRIVACGSRNDAYQSFRTAIGNGEAAMLLVDSEGPVNSACQTGTPDTWRPWEHLRMRDNWQAPDNSSETDCHLMVQVMESWFLTDPQTLAAFFGQGFNQKALPAAGNAAESIAKSQVIAGLEQASQGSKAKGRYGKGKHSFELLARIAPDKVIAASPWARRFMDELKKKMS